MEVLGLLGMVSFVGASTAVGGRLVWMGRRSRRLPELTIGLSFLLAGTLGAGLAVAGGVAGAGAAARALAAAADLSVNAGVACLALFTWRVFRPEDSLGVALFTGCLAALAVGFLGQLRTTGFDPRAASDPWGWLSLGARLVLYGWAATESLLQHFAGRRRVALGLADPVAVDRFRLWAIGLLAVIGIWLLSAAARVLGFSFREIYLPTALLGLVCAGSLWLAFFPPRAYERHVAASAAS